MKVKNKISLIQKIGLILFGIILSFFLMEIVLRAASFFYVLSMDARNSSLDKEDYDYTVLCVGESTTMCGGVNSYPRLLEKELANHYESKIRVINKGRASVDTSGIVVNIEEYVRTYKPDIVIGMMGVNDSESMETFVARGFLGESKLYALCEMILKRFSVRNKTSVNLAMYYRSQGKYNRATKILEKIIEEDDENFHAYEGLYYCYRDIGRGSETTEILEAMIEKGIGERWAYGKMALGEYFEEKKEFFYKKALDTVSPSPNILFDYGSYLFLKKRDYSGAKEIFESCAELHTRHATYYRALAVCCLVSGDSESARYYFDKAESVKDEEPLFYYPNTVLNMKKIARVCADNNAKVILMQYPMRDIDPLKKAMSGSEDLIFVENKHNFMGALNRGVGYSELFQDMFAGDFGHCTARGNGLIARNVADTVLKILRQKNIENRQ